MVNRMSSLNYLNIIIFLCSSIIPSSAWGSQDLHLGSTVVLPNAICQDITVYLDSNGAVSITADQIDGGSSDDSGSVTLSIDNDTFTCEDVGDNTVILTVTNVNGDETQCNATVSVVDDIAPEITCLDITIQLDDDGFVMINSFNTLDTYTDNCEVLSTSLSPFFFTCSETGDNLSTVTMNDVNGNLGHCSFTVTVEDNIPPDAICQPYTLTLGSDGNGTLDASEIDGGSSDACGIESLLASPSSFTIDDIGEQVVTLTVIDTSGNSSTCSSIVNIEEGTALPVELESFEARQNDCKHIELLWTSLTEINNDYFTLERSIGNTNQFEEIAKIYSIGNDNNRNHYNYKDNIPLLNSDYIYYRLGQTDNDGSHQLFKTIHIDNNCNITNAAFINPNPFDHNIIITTTSEHPLTLEIYDHLGRLLKRTDTNINSHIIQTDNWRSGLYLANIIDKGIVIHSKVLLKK